MEIRLVFSNMAKLVYCLCKTLTSGYADLVNHIVTIFGYTFKTIIQVAAITYFLYLVCVTTLYII